MTPFEQAVASLGDTTESVTEALRAKGIKGYRQAAMYCPIAKYLNACGFKIVSIATHAHNYIRSRDENADEAISLNDGVKQWVRDFDDGKYPEFYLE